MGAGEGGLERIMKIRVSFHDRAPIFSRIQPLKKERARGINYINVSWHYKISSCSDFFLKNVCKYTIFKLQQSIWYIFGIAQNFQFNVGVSCLKKGGHWLFKHKCIIYNILYIIHIISALGFGHAHNASIGVSLGSHKDNASIGGSLGIPLVQKKKNRI